MDDRRPIGVFDSGVGGLTSVKELHRKLPHENIVYFGDTGRVPYGTRSGETVRRYTQEIIQYLDRFDVKALLAACGTISSNFLPEDYQALNIDAPYITVVAPAAKKAVQATKNKKVGVLATTSSIKSSSYTKAIHAIDPDITVVGKGCPLLVSLVEQGMIERDNQITRLTLEMYLEPLLEAQVDTILLGCTHFPLLIPIMRDIVEDHVVLIDSGAAAVEELSGVIVPNQSGAQGTTEYHVTDTVEHFISTASVFLEQDISQQIHYVNPESL